MKLKTWAFVAASAIGMNASALDLNSYIENENDQLGIPTIMGKDYYANTNRHVFKKNGNKFEQMYVLEDGAFLIDENNGLALGYAKDENYIWVSRFFVCEIEYCNDQAYRKEVPMHNMGLYDTKQTSFATQNMISPRGISVIKSRVDAEELFTVSAINAEGSILDSFKVTPKISYGAFSIKNYSLVATTGITNEVEFKFLSANYGQYITSLKKWNKISKHFIDLPMYLSDGRELNSSFPKGLAPIAISNPKAGLSNRYTIVLGVLEDKGVDNPIIRSVVWGDVDIVDDQAEFIEPLKSSSLPKDYSALNLSIQNPIFHKSNGFTFSDVYVDLNTDYSARPLEIDLDGHNAGGRRIWGSSEDGDLVVHLADEGYRYFSPSNTCQ